MAEKRLSEWLYIEEFAAAVGISRRTVQNRIYEGKIKASRPGRKILIHRDQIERLLAKTRIGD